MSQEQFAQRVGKAAFMAELATSRALRYPEAECYDMAARTLNDVYLLCFEADRPAVWPFDQLNRWVRNRG